MMAPPKGFKHSDDTRDKMSASRKGRKFSDEHRAALSASLTGKKKSKNYPKTCPCGTEFMSGRATGKYCSNRCSRAARGHGVVHSPAYAHFERKCAICGSEDRLVGDHDHVTGEPRGILCRNCNVSLGCMADDPERLRAAADYLERSRCNDHT